VVATPVRGFGRRDRPRRPTTMMTTRELPKQPSLLEFVIPSWTGYTGRGGGRRSGEVGSRMLVTCLEQLAINSASPGLWQSTRPYPATAHRRWAGDWRTSSPRSSAPTSTYGWAISPWAVRANSSATSRASARGCTRSSSCESPAKYDEKADLVVHGCRSLMRTPGLASRGV